VCLGNGKMAVIGPAGSFSEQCGLQHFPTHEPFFCPSLQEVLEAVKRRDSEFALVPFENSNSGSIKEVQKEMFALAGQLFITAFVPHHVEHHLFSFEATLDTIIEVSSKDAALAQCDSWLADHLPRARRISASSTAAAVSNLDKSRAGAAAIGSTECQAYRVPILATAIQSEPNVTLFCTVMREIPETTVAQARFALFGIPDFSDSKFEKILEAVASVDCAISHNWVIEDMDECPPNTGIFEIGIPARNGMFNALLFEMHKALPEAFLAGSYFSIGFSEFSALKHQPYAPANFDY
jgi:chorismate mutase / prephenate dehydratase